MTKAMTKHAKAPAPRLLNYTTAVAHTRTIEEIVRLLGAHGATEVRQRYEAGEVSAVEFSIVTPWGELTYRLPADVDGALVVMQEQGRLKVKPLDRRYINAAQARRVAWRINKDALEAMLALVQARQTTFDQLLMPYEVQTDGRTLYEVLAERRQALPAARSDLRALMK